MNHDDRDLDFVRRHLQSSLPPLANAELSRDLWPNMLRRLDEPIPAFGWFESVLVAAVAIAFAFFPELLPAILYHL